MVSLTHASNMVVFETLETTAVCSVSLHLQAFGAGLRALGLELGPRRSGEKPHVGPVELPAFRPQPEGDFNTLTGKFKIMMYEANNMTLIFVKKNTTSQDTCADWQVCAHHWRVSFWLANGPIMEWPWVLVKSCCLMLPVICLHFLTNMI